MTLDCIIPPSVRLESGVTLGPRVVFVEGAPTLVHSEVDIEAAAVIGPGITIGRGAFVQAGAVVLRDVPPNAVVEGNPAQLVGYRNTGRISRRADITIKDISDFSGLSAPARIDLGVSNSALYLMRRVVDARGSLTVGEVDKELPFRPERYFMVFDVPSSEARGEHAHRLCHQFLLCVNGSCRVLLDDGESRCEVTLDRPELGVHMPPMIWGTQYRYSRDAMLLVFASRPYESEDYIRTYDDFRSELEQKRP